MAVSPDVTAVAAALHQDFEALLARLEAIVGVADADAPIADRPAVPPAGATGIAAGVVS